jgi:hypothetical protein
MSSLPSIMDSIWVYQTSSSYKTLDDAENEQIEQMWLRDISGYIWSNTFQGYVHIDTSYMILSKGPCSYTIARVKYV